MDKSTWLDYVVPYGLLNEGRSNWRALLSGPLMDLLDAYNVTTIDDAVSLVNGYTNVNESVWTLFSQVCGSVRCSSGSFHSSPVSVRARAWVCVCLQDAIVFKSSQTPLIYDPMSVLQFGYASCTGVSVLLVDALRSVGVPARVVGTPAWNGNASNGNHNWIEVYRGPDVGWSFIEPRPAGSGETLDDPCDKWFCNPSHFPSPNDTPVYAARFNATGVPYPMAWDPSNTAIPGVDRTSYYGSVCNACA